MLKLKCVWIACLSMLLIFFHYMSQDEHNKCEQICIFTGVGNKPFLQKAFVHDKQYDHFEEGEGGRNSV